MITLSSFSFKLSDYERGLDAFRTFLADPTRAIPEQGAGGLEEFFDSHHNLLALLGDTFGPGFTPAGFAKEPTIAGEFRADYLVSSRDRRKILLIELEDASPESIFKLKGKPKTTQSYEWSSRFEHGFSQVLDWHYRLDDYARTNKIEENFGSRSVEFEGILIVGRDHFLRDQGCSSRFNWRVQSTIINNKRFGCMTVEGVLEELAGRVDMLKSVRMNE